MKIRKRILGGLLAVSICATLPIVALRVSVRLIQN